MPHMVSAEMRLLLDEAWFHGVGQFSVQVIQTRQAAGLKLDRWDKQADLAAYLETELNP